MWIRVDETLFRENAAALGYIGRSPRRSGGADKGEWTLFPGQTSVSFSKLEVYRIAVVKYGPATSSTGKSSARSQLHALTLDGCISHRKGAFHLSRQWLRIDYG
jgi:hypothetical protein